MIQLHDKTFVPYLSEEEIQKKIAEMSSKMKVLKTKRGLSIFIADFMNISDLARFCIALRLNFGTIGFASAKSSSVIN